MATRVDLLLSICDHYYNKKMTQGDIAKIFDISRATVSRLLEEARDLGIVQINIVGPLELNEGLALKLKDRFKLREVVVINSLNNYDFDLKNLGIALNSIVNKVIQNGNIIGLSWGSAVESYVNCISDVQWENVEIVQINGSLNSGNNSISGSEIVIELGKKTLSNYKILTAPAYVDSYSLQQELLNQFQIKETMNITSKIDVSITGIGDFDKNRNTLYNSGILSDQDITKLQTLGTVGHIAGNMFDKNGAQVISENLWPVAPTIEQLKHIPIRIGGVIGENRLDSVTAALQGELINVLICDEKLAEKIIKTPI